MNRRGRKFLPWLLVLLALAVPALLTDLECMVGPGDCCPCQVGHSEAEADDCSAASLAVTLLAAPGVPPADPGTVAPPPPARPAPLVWAEPEDQRAPREGPPPLAASGLRAPPA